MSNGLINRYLDYMGRDNVKVTSSINECAFMGETINAKEGYSDLVAILDTGHKYSIEMYTSFGESEFIKTFIYLIRMLIEDINESDEYTKLKKVYGLCFIPCNYHKINKLLVNLKGFVDVLNPDLNIDNYIELSLIRLDKVAEPEYTGSKQPLIKLLKLINAKSWEEVENLKGDDPYMEEVVRTMRRYLNNPNYSNAYEKELENIRLAKVEGIAEGKAKGLAEGKAKGKAEGIAEGKMETAKNLLEYGIPISVISVTTGLSEEEINNLKVIS